MIQNKHLNFETTLKGISNGYFFLEVNTVVFEGVRYAIKIFTFLRSIRK